MSLIISITHPEAIIMASDTRIITTYTTCQDDGEELVPTDNVDKQISDRRKTSKVRDIGCLSFWGEATRTPGYIEQFIGGIIKPDDDVVSASEKLYQYLRNDIRPDDHLGFHLGGYDRTGLRKLYHIFYSIQIGEEHKGRDFYKNEEDSGTGDKYKIVYNGEPKYAHQGMALMKELESKGYLVSPANHTLESCKGLAVSLINHTAKMVKEEAESQTVGGNIKLLTVFPGNKIREETHPCAGEQNTFTEGSGDSIDTGGRTGQKQHPRIAPSGTSLDFWPKAKFGK